MLFEEFEFIFTYIVQYIYYSDYYTTFTLLFRHFYQITRNTHVVQIGSSDHENIFSALVSSELFLSFPFEWGGGVQDLPKNKIASLTLLTTIIYLYFVTMLYITGTWSKLLFQWYRIKFKKIFPITNLLHLYVGPSRTKTGAMKSGGTGSPKFAKYNSNQNYAC